MDSTGAASAAMRWKLGTLWEPCAASLCSRYYVIPTMQAFAADWHCSMGIWALIEVCRYSECGASTPSCLETNFVSFARQLHACCCEVPETVLWSQCCR